jgi:hypothetical protein
MIWPRNGVNIDVMALRTGTVTIGFPVQRVSLQPTSGGEDGDVGAHGARVKWKVAPRPGGAVVAHPEHGFAASLVAIEPNLRVHDLGGMFPGVAKEERTARKRPAAGQLLAFDGDKSPATLLEAVQRIFEEAKTAGRTVRAVGNVSGYGKMDFRTLMEYEPRVDALLRRFGAQVICQYDVRRFEGPQLLRALKVHPDTSRYPLMTG